MSFTAAVWENNLEKAIKDGDLDKVRGILGRALNKHGVDMLDDPQFTNSCFLATACIFGHKEIVLLLIERGADVNEAKFGYGYVHSPLQCACENGQKEIAKILLEAGGQIHAATDGGRKPIHLAKTPEVAALLLDNGASITDLTDGEKGETPLIAAVMQGNLDVADFLMSKGGSINDRTKKGETVLHLTSSISKAKFMLDRGCNPTIENNKGETAVAVAKRKGFNDLATMLEIKRQEYVLKAKHLGGSRGRRHAGL